MNIFEFNIWAMHTHLHMITHRHTHRDNSREYSQRPGERGGLSSVTVMTGRCGDSVDWSSVWSVSCQLRGNLRSLFNVPTPLRWKFLRFPNVVYRTAHHSCLLTPQHTHSQSIHTLTHILYIMGKERLPAGSFWKKSSGLVLQVFTTVVAVPLASSASCVTGGRLCVCFSTRTHTYTCMCIHTCTCTQQLSAQ